MIKINYGQASITFLVYRKKNIRQNIFIQLSLHEPWFFPKVQRCDKWTMVGWLFVYFGRLKFR